MPLNVDKLETGSLFVNGTEITGGGGSSDIISTSVTLTPSQILNLYSNPQVLVPTPGSNKGIQVVSAAAFLDYNSTPYSTSAQDIQIISRNSLNKQGATKAGDLLTSTQDTIIIFDLGVGGVGINEDLLVSLNNSNPTSGDSSIRIFLSYKIIDIS